MSIWDLHKIRRKAKADGVPDLQVDQEYIKQCYVNMRELEEQAAKKTKELRKQAERRRAWEAAQRPKVTSEMPTSLEESALEDEVYEPLEPFTEDD